jgi:uncharacterized membrane protein
MNVSNAPAPRPSAIPGLRIVQVLSSLAFGLSAFLLWGSLTGQRLPGCGLESGCGAVTSTRWAYLFRVPVSLPALALYAGILFATVSVDRATQPSTQRALRRFLAAAGSALLGAAGWFIALQIFVIGAICPFCMAAHGCGLVVGSVLLWSTLRNHAGGAGGTGTSGSGGRFVLAGLSAVALLVAGQIVYRPKTFAVSSSAELAARKVPRKIQLHGGAFQLDLGDVPLLGTPEAPCVIVHLFDYCCPHCRALHPLLMEAYRNMSNRVAIANLPVPMATNCNRLIKRQIPAHINACAYAAAGLAVWRANPAQLQAFDDWIYGLTPPPPPETVQAKAMQLVGTNQFDQALLDPWIRQQLEFNISLFETNYRRYHRDVLPQLMIGTNLVFGDIHSVGELYKLISVQLEAPRMGGATNGH